MEEKLSRDERRDPIDLETIIAIRRDRVTIFRFFFFISKFVFFDDEKTNRNSFAFLSSFVEFEKILTYFSGSARVLPLVTKS